jgi:hypothetical protein
MKHSSQDDARASRLIRWLTDGTTREDCIEFLEIESDEWIVSDMIRDCESAQVPLSTYFESDLDWLHDPAAIARVMACVRDRYGLQPHRTKR